MVSTGVPEDNGSVVEETERRVMPAPARGLAVALGLIAASAVLVAAAFAVNPWPAGRLPVHAAAPPASDPVELLSRIALAIAVIGGLAALAGALLRRLGQPTVVGEIIAGLVLGPSVLSTVAPGLHGLIFPPQVMPFVRLAAQLGLCIFMFTVGAEFDPGLLRGQRGVIAAASLAMMALPFALGVAVAVPLLRSFAGPAATPVTFVLFTGTALSVTAFPVLARIVQDTGLRGTRLGALAMVCAAVADVLAWIALAVVLAMAHAQNPAGVLRTAAFTIALSAACVFGLRPLARRLSARRADAAVQPAVPLLTVLTVIIVLTTVTDRIGIHPIFGAFLAGLVLPVGDPVFGAPAGQLGRVNRAVLVPVFFASIGMQADVRLAISHPAVLAAGALLLAAAVAGKLGSATPVAWAGGMPARAAGGLGVLMNARGVTEIVVLSIGLSAGVINRVAFTVLVLMALLTTCMAGPALRLLRVARPTAREGLATLPPAPADLEAGTS